MEINKVEGVTIDGKNMAYGGYIYKVRYNPSNGEGLSSFTVTIINEKGSYSIDKSILTEGATTKIKIGNDMNLEMIPFEYRTENSASGKLLEIDFVDQSLLYLDRYYIGLKGRIKKHPNIILLGKNRKRRVISMEKNRVYDKGFDKEEDKIRSFPFTPIYKDDESTNDYIKDEEINIEEEDEPIDETKVDDVEYTLPDLYEAIDGLKKGGLIGEGKELLTGDELNHFWKSHTGKLRDVLSAWCNDLGYSFYWEDGKLNFHDSKDSNNLSYIESNIIDFCDSINVESENESYTLQGTFTRACNSFFGRDGSLQSSMEEDDEPDFLMKNFRLSDVPWTTAADSFIRLNEEHFNNTIKAANYGNDYVMSYLALRNATTFWQDFSYQSRVAFNYRKLNLGNSVDSNIADYCYDKLSTRVTGTTASYNWVIVERKDETDLTKFLSRYKALANFYGRFFTMRMTSNFFQKYMPEDTSLEWYDEYTLLKNTNIGKALSPLSNLIKEFETTNLKDFFAGSIILTDPGGRGFAIKERETEQEWKPVNSEDVVKIGDIMIIEGELDSLIPDNVFLVVAPTTVSFNPSIIKFPSLAPVEVYARTSSSHLVNLVEPKIEWNETSFGNFGSPNVASVEVLHTNISEEQIRDSGLQKDSPDDYLTEENFKEAHKLYSNRTTFSQTLPYFSKSVTTSSLDGSIPKIGEGLISMDINITQEGLKVNYNFGTELLQVRPAGTYFQILSNKKHRDRFIHSSHLLNGKRGIPGD